MEKNVKRLIEQHIKEIVMVETEFTGKVNEECGVKLHQAKALQDLKTEEQILKIQLENLKKENFSLEISIDAWKATFEQKQNELAEAESKLNDVYNEIWSTREEFCKRADEFNNRYGILSEWCEEKVIKDFNSLLEKDEENYLEKREQLEMEIDEVKKVSEKNQKLEESEAEIPQGVKLNSELQKEASLGSENRNKNEFPEERKTTEPAYNKECNENAEMQESFGRAMVTLHSSSFETDNFKGREENPKKKKVRFSKEGNEIKIFNENPENLKNKFFSIIDAETVKKANRIKNRQKNQFLHQIKKITPNGAKTFQQNL